MFVLGVSSSKVQELQMDGVGDTRLDAGWAREIHGIGHVSSNGVGSCRLASIWVADADPSLKARYAIRRVNCSFIFLTTLCSRFTLGDSILLLVVALLCA